MPDVRGLGAALIVLAVYAAVWLAMPPGGFYSPDEGTKFLQMRSIGWDDGLTYSVPYGGAAIDPEYAYYPTRCRHEDLYPVKLADGGVKLHWPIWFSLVTAAPVAVLGLKGLYVVPLLCGWIIALLSGRLVRAYDARLAPLAILAVGLATPVAFFSLTHWEHTLASALGMAGLVLAVEPGATARRALAVALLLGAIVLRIELAPFALAVALAWSAAARDRSASRQRLLIALALVAVAVGAAALFGFLPARHLWLLKEIPTYALASLRRLPHLPDVLAAILIDAPGNQAPELPAPLRVVALVAVAAAVVAPWLRRSTQAALGLIALFVLIDCCVLLGMLPQPYLSLHGFVPVSPFVVLAAWALPDARHATGPRRALALAAIAYVLLGLGLIFTFSVEPDGRYRTGVEWGNRYLLTLYPLATVLGLGGLQLWRSAADVTVRRLITILAAGLLLCGVWMEARGLWVLYQSRNAATQWQAALPAEPGVPVVTDVWWLAASMAPFFETHPMHCVRDASDLSAWLSLAQARGVDEFAFASFKTMRADPPTPAGVSLERDTTTSASGLHVTRFRLHR